MERELEKQDMNVMLRCLRDAKEVLNTFFDDEEYSGFYLMEVACALFESRMADITPPF